MASNYYSRVIDAIRRQGFNLARQGKGAHEIWASSATGAKVCVPRKLRNRHTANAILKDAGCAERV